MRAVAYRAYGPPEVLRVVEVERPTPGRGEVLVRVHATTVTAVDVFYRRGFPLLARLDAGILRPKRAVLGGALAGVIAAVGAGVGRFAEGDRVYGIASGTHADPVRLSADAALAPMPVGLSFERAAAVPYGALTALHFLRDVAEVRSGQRVLVNGASGGVGAYAVQLAKLFGAHVTGVASAEKQDMVRSMGADRVLDYAEEDFTRRGERYDVVFDAAAKSAVARSGRALADGGLYLTTVPTPAVLLRMLWPLGRARTRARVAFAGMRPADERASDLAYLGGLLEAGAIAPVVDRCYPLERAVEAHTYVEGGSQRGSVVLTTERPAGPRPAPQEGWA